MTNRSIVLASRQAMTLPRHFAGAWLVCVRGYLWVTEPGDPADYLLEAGERRFLAPRPGIVISAVGPAEAQLLPEARRSPFYGTTAAACSDC